MGKKRRLHHQVQKSHAHIQMLNKRKTALICMVLAVVTIAAYWPVLSAGFVGYDDNDYVTENQHVLKGLTFDGLKWAFSMNGYASNWHPLTWLSHMLDCRLFGQNAGLHHLTNLIIHTASAVLLLLVLVSMTGRLWPGAFVAAAFALHPLHVESVAWIAERKDVLSGFFWLLTMACYLRYTRTGRISSYLLTLVVFGLGLMAKPMLVTLPFVLLLLDYWPLKRLESAPAAGRFRTVRSLAVEKIPFLVLSAASCVITYIVQQAGEAISPLELVPLGARLSNVMVSYIAYIVKMVRPVDLAVLYPFKYLPLRQSLPAFLIITAVTIAAVFGARRRQYFAVGWLWYLGTLVPVIGLVQIGSQCLADRYTYIPLIGLFIAAAWAAADLCYWRPSLRFVSGVTAVLLLAGMFAGVRNQLNYWKDSIALFSHTIQVTENNFRMHNNLGAALVKKGRLDEAIDHYHCALQINPDHITARINLGSVLADRGQLDEAIDNYCRALQIDPDNAEAHNNLGTVLVEKGQLDEAIDHYRRALQVNPDYADACNNLGVALVKKEQSDEAIGYYRRALQINPNHATAHNNLGNILMKKGQLGEAISHFRRALQINPDCTKSHFNNLAWILATAADPALRDPAEAVRLAEKAYEFTDHKNAVVLDTLAAAYASAERFDDAVATAGKALELAEADGNKILAQKIRDRLKLFKEGQSYIEKPSTNNKISE